jgi:hypothetical protein
MNTGDSDPYRLFSNAYSVLSRLHNAITFTFVRFLYSTLTVYIEEAAIFWVCCIGICLLSLLPNDEMSLTHDVFRIFTLIMSQNIINITTDHDNLFKVGARFDIQTLMNFTMGTVLLMLSAEFCKHVDIQPWVRQIMTLILFMYAEALQRLIALLEIGGMVVILSVLVYFIIFRYRSYIEQIESLNYVTQALQMTCINLVLNDVVPLQLESPFVHTGFLILILMMVDVMASILTILAETREYAMWKVAGRLAVIYAETQVPIVVSVVMLVLVFYLSSLHVKNTHVIMDLSILTLLNHIVDVTTVDVMHVAGMQKAVDAFSYIIIFNAFMRVLNAQSDQ